MLELGVGEQNQSIQNKEAKKKKKTKKTEKSGWILLESAK